MRNIEEAIQKINDAILFEVSQLQISLPEQQNLAWNVDLHENSIIIQDQEGVTRMLDNETGEYIVRDFSKNLQGLHVVRGIIPINKVFNGVGYIYEVDFIGITNKKIADKICIKAFESEKQDFEIQNITLNQSTELLNYYVSDVKEWGQDPKDRVFRIYYRVNVQSISIDYSIID